MVFLDAPCKISGGRSGMWTPSLSKSLPGEVFFSFRREHVVWALRQWKDPDLGPASSIQLLDQPGFPENGDLQR